MRAEVPCQTLDIDGVSVRVEGSGSHTVLMLHGWPDTLQLWDGTVAALQDRFRCVRLTLPGFDLAQPARATPLARMSELLCQVLDRVSPGQTVTLLLHDWGCAFGYEFAAKHPQRVARIVAVDIGDYNSKALQRTLSLTAKCQVWAYQVWLALAWMLGRHVSVWMGNRMTRWMAQALRCPAPAAQIGWQMNYPYAMRWFGLAGGLHQAAPVQAQRPLLYLYGQRKPFMFHSPAWLAQVAARPDSAVRGFRAGHWVMLDQPEEFHACVCRWLLISSPIESPT
jgi:pimeloyl-ACP methyl ester carboxylesterase